MKTVAVQIYAVQRGRDDCGLFAIATAPAVQHRRAGQSQSLTNVASYATVAGDKAGILDSSFIRELFLQCQPPNVRTVLASTGDTIALEELAQLAVTGSQISPHQKFAAVM